MRRLITVATCRGKTILLLFFTVTLFGCVGGHHPGPPPLVLDRSPSVVHIPGSYVYLLPGLNVDVFFYGDYWYRRYNNVWFRASSYDGSWVKVKSRKVPAKVHKLPEDFRRHLEPDAYRIPHGELKKHWKRWERDSYWDRVGEMTLQNKQEKK